MQRMTNKLKSRFNAISVSKKITALYAVFFMVLLIFLSSFMLINAWLYYGSVSRSELEETADKVADYIESGGDINADAIEALNPNKYVRVAVTEHGSERRRPIGSREFPPPEPGMSPNDNGRLNFRTGKFNDENYMYTMRLASYGGKEYSVQVFRPQNAELGVMRTFIIIFVAANALALLLSAAIGRLISKKMLKPIREMTETVDKINAENLGRRIDLPAADDEFRALALTFNNMFDRLEDSFEKQKQFVSDASHELRTPISVIQGYAALIDRWGKSDEAVLQESISSIKSETDHMNILINQLLFLAREDNGTSALNPERVNVRELAEEVVYESRMTAEDTVFTVSGEKEAWVYADSHLIKQTLRIIIENALKYKGTEKCRVDTEILNSGENTVIAVSDNGIGIPQEDIKRIFDRFYRSDKSRNKQISGNGLGLSIAYAIIKRHNGRIWAENRKGGGCTFFVELKRDCRTASATGEQPARQ